MSMTISHERSSTASFANGGAYLSKSLFHREQTTPWLGDELSVRFPVSTAAADQAAKEQSWLPRMTGCRGHTKYNRRRSASK